MCIIFCQRIKELRQEHEMSQREFAKLLGVTQGALCRWELGENVPKIDVLYQIAKALDVSSDYLLGLTDE